jgi:hypothetical protein
VFDSRGGRADSKRTKQNNSKKSSKTEAQDNVMQEDNSNNTEDKENFVNNVTRNEKKSKQSSKLSLQFKTPLPKKIIYPRLTAESLKHLESRAILDDYWFHSSSFQFLLNLKRITFRCNHNAAFSADYDIE